MAAYLEALTDVDFKAVEEARLNPTKAKPSTPRKRRLLNGDVNKSVTSEMVPNDRTIKEFFTPKSKKRKNATKNE